MPAPAHPKKTKGAHKAHRPRHRSLESRHSAAAAKGGSIGGGSNRKTSTRQPSTGRRSSSGSSKPAKSSSGSPKREAAPQRQVSIKEQLRRVSATQGFTGDAQRKVARPFSIRFHRSVDEFSSRERQQIQNRRSQLAIGTCVAVLAVVALLAFSGVTFILIAPRAHKWVSSMRGLTLIERLEKACQTDDCRKAVAKMNESVDATVNPCEDVYHYACGHWRELDDAGEPMSYEDSVRHHYVIAVHEHFTGGAPPSEQCRSDDPSAKMTCVYASCVAFYTNRSASLSSLLTAADLDVFRWMHARNFTALFTLVVQTAVRTRLPSVLRVTSRDQNTADVEFGTCLSCCSDDPDFSKHLVDLAAEVFAESDHVDHSNLRRLDETLRQISQAPWNLPAQVVDADQFTSLDKSTWHRVLADSGAFSAKPEDMELVSANPRGIERIVAALDSVPLSTARLYTLLAPVAPYLAVEIFEAGRRASMSAFRAWSVCVEDMAFLFTVPFDTFFASSLGTEKAAVTFRSMWSNIRVAAANALHIGKDLVLNEEALMAADIKDFEDTGLDDPSFSEHYGEDFMANLILYHRHGSRRFRAAQFRSDAPPKDGGVPTKYFLPDYYYGGATEQTLNTGTLGVLTAAMLFKSSYRENTEPLEYPDCFAQYTRYTLNLPVDKTDWLRHTRARWSVETAFAARDIEHDSKELDALHYLRFARTYCGEEDANVLPLQFAVRSSENFNKTFDCGYRYPVIAC